jgi:PIN domain nuclease of toxin-antitoxin system
VILLDTHAMIWLVLGSERLGRTARRRCEELAPAQGVLVSTISFWEIATLVRKNRFQLGTSPGAWRDGVLRQGIIEVPLDGMSAIEAPGLSNFHADPADQLIVATAIRSNAALLTADERILQWHGQLARQDARV